MSPTPPGRAHVLAQSCPISWSLVMQLNTEVEGIYCAGQELSNDVNRPILRLWSGQNEATSEIGEESWDEARCTQTVLCKRNTAEERIRYSTRKESAGLGRAPARSTCWDPHTGLGDVELLPRPQSACVPIFLLFPSHHQQNRRPSQCVGYSAPCDYIIVSHICRLISHFFLFSRNHARTLSTSLARAAARLALAIVLAQASALNPTQRTEPSLPIHVPTLFV